MAKITHIMAYEVLDSRGNPTVMTEISLASGSCGMAYIPSGASTGSQETLELRDEDFNRYNGKGVLKAVKSVNVTLRDNLLGKDILSQCQLDEAMRRLDGSDNKRVLGANAILSVSLAFAKAVASERQQVLYEYLAYLLGDTGKFILPVPLVNIINGGVHSDNKLEIQEFMVLPVAAPCFKEALRCSAEIFHALKASLKEKGLNTNVGDEGGFAPDLQSNQQAIEYILQAIERAGYKSGQDVYLGLDAASTEFYREEKYHFENRVLDREEWIEYLENLVRQYPLLSIEDGMAEKDQKGWRQLTGRLGEKIQLVGDDLFVTNPALLKQGIVDHLANAILIKFNQIGTLSETLEAIKMAKESNYSAIISHRSGETEDTTIADLAVGTGVGQIKAGSICRTDRIAKYNRLLRIEAELVSGGKATYGGRQAFSRFLASDVK